MRIYPALLIIIILLVSDGCSALYIPGADSNGNSGLTDNELNNLQQGRSLYIKNCGSCHYLHIPNELTKKEWSDAMQEMASKTALNSDQIDQVLLYLQGGAKDI